MLDRVYFCFILLSILLSCRVATPKLPALSEGEYRITLKSQKGYYVNVDVDGGDTMIASSKINDKSGCFYLEFENIENYKVRIRTSYNTYVGVPIP